MNIYLPVEIKSRELEGKLLLALTAAERGHVVVLGEKSNTRSLAANGILPPGILHNKSLTPSEKALKLLGNLKKNNHIITCQDEESGLVDESYDSFARLRFSEKSIEMTDGIFAWGRHDEETLKRIFGGYKQKFTATGSPRVDYWRKDLKAYYDSGPVAEKVKSLDSFILISSNFSAFLNQNRFFDMIARLRDANYFDRNPQWEQYQYDNFAYQSQLIYEFIKLIRYLSGNLKNINILIRPHPVESIDGWKKVLGSLPNVHVIREGAIGKWLHECELVIQNGCTTAIEAAALGKPRIAYRPLPNKLEREVPNSISYQAFSKEECKKIIDRILKNEPVKGADDVQNKERTVLNERFANISGKLAADRIVDEWEKLAENSELGQSSPEELIAIKDDYFTNKYGLLDRLKKQAAILLKNNRKSKSSGEIKLKNAHKFPSFTDEEYQLMKENINRALNRYNNIECRRFGKKSVILYSK